MWAPMIVTKTISQSLSANLSSTIESANLLIIPYSQAAKVIGRLNKEKHSPFHIVVADEAHRLRNKTSELHKAFASLDCKYKWFLTGTPMERDEEDLRNILIALDKAYIRIANDANFQILKERYEKITLRRLKNEVLSQLPKSRKQIHWIELDQSSANFYNKTQNQMHNANPKDRIGFINRLLVAAAGTQRRKKCTFA